MTAIKPAGRYADIAGCWCGYCGAANTVDEIKRRLSEVPEHLREDVTEHCRAVWVLRQRQRRAA